jgi:polygalacturonase
VRGRGILSGAHIDRYGGGWKNLVNIHSNSSNVTVNGIIMLDSPTWNLNLRQSSGIRIEDVKIVGARPNSDGIDLVGCRDSYINRCFVRAWDDCLCVKTDNTGNTNNINFSGCILWTDLAQSMEVGYETRSDVMSNITFKDIDVIHAFHKPVMSIHAGDRASIENVTWQDIRVEDAKLNSVPEDNLLMDLWIGSSVWSQDAERGKIKGVTFRNISVLGGKAMRSRVHGFDGNHRISGVTFDNVTMMGKPIRTMADGAFVTNGFADAPTFTWTKAMDIGCTSLALAPRDMPILSLVPGETRSLLYRHPGKTGSALWDVRGRNAGLPATLIR